MTTKEQVSNAKMMYYLSLKNYITAAKQAVVEQGGFWLRDESSDEVGKSVHICIHDHYPSFDQVNFNVLLNPERTILIFHVVDGDNFFPNNKWVSEDELSEDNLLELFNYIAWDDATC